MTDIDLEAPVCDNCGYPAKLEAYQSPKKGFGHYDNLCDICANTLLSHAMNYPDHVDDPRLWQAIAYIGNMVLDEVRRYGNEILLSVR